MKNFKIRWGTVSLFLLIVALYVIIDDQRSSIERENALLLAGFYEEVELIEYFYFKGDPTLTIVPFEVMLTDRYKLKSIELSVGEDMEIHEVLVIHARLAILYDKIAKEKESNYHFKKAKWLFLDAYGNELTRESLSDYVEQVDGARMKYNDLFENENEPTSQP